MDRFHAVTEAALKGLDVAVETVKNIAAAKRKLVDNPPDFILCSFSLRGNPDAGPQFSAELHKHPTLAKVPVLLIANELNDGLIRKAADSGAQGLLAWPVPVGALRIRITSFLHPEKAEQKSATSGIGAATAAAAESSRSTVSRPTPTQPGHKEEDPKLQLAQRLLAQVLHNIRTSDLLRVIEQEDVPRAVFEITRTVCGIKPDKKLDEKDSDPSSSKDEIDLDTVFGQKK